MIGMEVADESGNPDGELIERMVDNCFKSKLLLLDCGIKNHIIRFVPPLNVSKAEIDKALSIIAEALPIAAAGKKIGADEKAPGDKRDSWGQTVRQRCFPCSADFLI